MKLSDYIDGFASKELVAVDLPDHGSNQHEINGVSALRKLIGDQEVKGTIHWWYMIDEGGDSVSVDTFFTFYDSRKKQTHRSSEWRLFYPDNEVLTLAKPRDLLVLLRVKGAPNNQLHGFVFPQGTSWHRKAQILFGEFGLKVSVISGDKIDGKSVELAQAALLDMLGLARRVTTVDLNSLVMRRFPSNTFPSTKDVAAFARESLGDISGLGPDERLDLYLKRETEVFYSFEKRVIGERLERPKAFETIEEFLSYSMTVLQRRKARMGHSLENQLEIILKEAGLKFDRQGKTEGKNTPDFLFPGAKEYRDNSYPAARLRMLGAKSSCKDRWRQVLAEAKRIESKHLCTLEPAITEAQTDDMTANGLVLVLPAPLHVTYTPKQRAKILTISQFIEEVRTLENL